MAVTLIDFSHSKLSSTFIHTKEMQRGLDTYLEIVPEFSDPDTYVTYTVSNGGCRTVLKKYADLYELASVAEALKGDDSTELKFQPSQLSIDQRCCMDMAFSVYPRKGAGKLLRVLIVNDGDADQPYRSETDIVLTYEEAKGLASELEDWVNKPVYHFIWKK